MMRLVLDTNVVVSAMLKPDGMEALVLGLVLGGLHVLCLTEPILAEYRMVLSRRKFRRLDAGLVQQVLDGLRSGAVFVLPARVLTASPDEADNRFLECAETASAQFLVTGTKRHFPAKWGQTEIVSARELIERIGPTLT